MPATGGIIAATIGGLTLLAGGLTAANTIRTRIGQLSPAIRNAGKSAISLIKNTGKRLRVDVKLARLSLSESLFRLKQKFGIGKFPKVDEAELSPALIRVPKGKNVEITEPEKFREISRRDIKRRSEQFFKRLKRRERRRGKEQEKTREGLKIPRTELSRLPTPGFESNITILSSLLRITGTNKASLSRRINKLNAKDLKSLQAEFDLRLGKKTVKEIKAALKRKFKL